jgi:hypothetical protein
MLATIGPSLWPSAAPDHDTVSATRPPTGKNLDLNHHLLVAMRIVGPPESPSSPPNMTYRAFPKSMRAASGAVKGI